MGGRGGSSGFEKPLPKVGSIDGVIMSDEVHKVEGIYREAHSWSPDYYKQEILEATTDGFGNVTFDYATPVKREKTAKTNRTVYLTYELNAGAVDGKTFNINWDKVQSIQGKTYSLRHAAKEAGLKWDPENKIWKRM